jgi:glycyl-tRNA synthetase beta chain
MTTQNLLVELFVEELPPKALKKLGEAFAEGVFSGLEINDFLEPTSVKTVFATPRRLAVHITDVRAVSQPRPQSPKTLMPASVGLDQEGKPTAPLLKKLRSMYHDDVDIDWLMSERVVQEEEGGKQVLKHLEGLAAGSPLFIRLEGAIEESLEKLPIPKMMAYQLHENCEQPGWTTVHFVRPAHGLLILHGDLPLDVIVLGLKATNKTCGHRFEAETKGLIEIVNADSYAQQLRDEGAVIVSFAERRSEIVCQLQAAAVPLGLKPIEDDALLDEVTALVERPNVLVGTFEEAFLEVPQECLILTMKANQKYFPLLDTAGKLTNKFLIVSNISPADASAVIQGNERVVRPRLADAKFFYDQDRKRPLDSRVLGLAKVVYHNKLGTQGERVSRVQSIARAIGEQIGGEIYGLMLSALADKAALLAKADLLTDMVGEFPELQGIMGRYYAQHDGLGDDIAFAIEDHYKPRFAGDELPRGDVGVCVALADKLETLVGMFSIGEKPTGDKDPFALRRHALGIIRLLVESKLQVSLDWLLQVSLMAHGDVGLKKSWSQKMHEMRLAELQTKELPGLQVVATGYEERVIPPNTKQDVFDFIFERFAGLLRDQGFSANEVDAVLSLRPPVLADIPKRLDAVRGFAALPEAPALAAANKRVGNILKKAEGEVGDAPDPARCVEEAEQNLVYELAAIGLDADADFEAGEYAASLQKLAALKAPVDAFFDHVMVNADDPVLKANRLALLNQLHRTMNRVADISRLAA